MPLNCFTKHNFILSQIQCFTNVFQKKKGGAKSGGINVWRGMAPFLLPRQLKYELMANKDNLLHIRVRNALKVKFMYHTHTQSHFLAFYIEKLLDFTKYIFKQT